MKADTKKLKANALIKIFTYLRRHWGKNKKLNLIFSCWTSVIDLLITSFVYRQASVWKKVAQWKQWDCCSFCYILWKKYCTRIDLQLQRNYLRIQIICKTNHFSAVNVLKNVFNFCILSFCRFASSWIHFNRIADPRNVVQRICEQSVAVNVA